jgi:hypothetical protein
MASLNSCGTRRFRIGRCAGLLFLLLSALLSAKGDPKPCSPSPSHTYGLKDTGNMVEGPVCVGITFNALRYGAQLALSTTYIAGKDLGAALSFTRLRQTPPTPQTCAVDDPKTQDTLPILRSAFTDCYAKFRELEKDDTKALVKVLAGAEALRSLVAGSDSIFRDPDPKKGGPSGVRSAAAALLAGNPVIAAQCADFQISDYLYFDVQSLQARAEALNTSTADELARLALLKADIVSLLATMDPYRLAAADKAVSLLSFSKENGLVDAWVVLINGITDDTFFMLKTYVPCGTLFNQNKQTAVRLLVTDRLPMFDGTALTEVGATGDPGVTVTCASPFAVSAGIEFSFLKYGAFGIVPNGTSGATQFGITDTSNISPLPMAIVHGRIHEWLNHELGIFGSFGVAAHVQGNGTAGSSAEFLAGVSIGLLRTIYVTPGWHIGKVSSLGGGYKVGDPVPTGVNLVPVTSSYTSGFGLAITFTKP